MTKLKKMTAVLLSVVMLVCCFSVQASAKSIFDDAIKISATEAVSHTFKNDMEVIYKVSFSDSGKISFYCSDYYYDKIWEVGSKISVLDTNGNTIIKEDFLAKFLNKEYTIDKKGTYYIRFINTQEKSFGSYQRGEYNYYKNFYYGFQPDHTPTISLALNVKVGDELDFSALASNYTGKVTYKTTDSKVATVDKGKVTCKKAGKAKIRAYMNNGDYAEITLVVKKK